MWYCGGEGTALCYLKKKISSSFFAIECLSIKVMLVDHDMMHCTWRDILPIHNDTKLLFQSRNVVTKINS